MSESPGGRKRRLSFSNVLAVVALFVALGGTAVAAGLARNSVGSKQIKTGAVQAAEIKDGAVAGTDVRDGSLLGADLQDGTITPADVRGGAFTGPRGARGPVGPGGSVAFGHVTYVGGALGLDAARSKNISVSEGPDFVCVDAKVPVRAAIAQTDFNGGVNALSTANVLYDTTGCPAGTDVQVVTKRADHGLLLEPFTIAFFN